MRKKKQPQSEPAQAPPKGGTTNAQPITVKRPLPPDALKRMREFYEISREVERQWRLIVGH